MVEKDRKKFYRKENAFKYVALISACVSILAVIVICFFIFSRGLPTIKEIGIKNFILGTKWSPTASPPSFGILPFIISSFYVTLGAVILGVPTGLFTAIFMAKYCPKKLHSTFTAGINLMAGIPSIIYGFFGLTLVVPVIAKVINKNGLTMLSAIIILGIMILPTVISLSQAAINSVDESYYEGAIGLGATKERAIFTVVLPAAKSGIISAIILGMGRAIGETMAVILVAGGQPRMPKGLFRGVRTMTMNIVTEMGYAAELHREALIATGAVLFIFILIINLLFVISKNRGIKHD
ncbi:phosphate ABC transporter permease subunit PstC [Lagierella massiliensis]|uniref:phosphate ABC transporter permease subunit PstC n=1 Tax=Lagierella massiliensis TaxID=1689303 RepID=UPI0006D84C8A|nr:phosphate ABC transporter permease subunit PstC [Lagierella massiliensis]